MFAILMNTSKPDIYIDELKEEQLMELERVDGKRNKISYMAFVVKVTLYAKSFFEIESIFITILEPMLIN